MLLKMSDPFQNAHKANARAAEKKQVEDTKAASKQVTVKKLLDGMKPVFNDIPPYKPRDPFRFGGPA